MLTPGSSVSTLAGSGTDAKTIAGAATSAALGSPEGVAYDAAGNLYIADARNHQVTHVDAAGQLTIIAGTGRQGFTGDGGPSTAAELNAPTGVAIDANGNVYIADSGNHRVRRIGVDGIISTVAGTGAPGFSGDGAVATAARLRSPAALAVDGTGALYIADTGNHRVRKLQADGTINTVAGDGNEGDTGDGGQAVAASLGAPSGLAVLPDGRLLIVDRAARRIRALNPDGTLSAYSPGGALTLRRPVGVTSDAFGTVTVADAANQRILQSSADGVSVLAGSGEQGGFVSGAPLATPLNTPTNVAVRSSGEVAVSDRHNHQVQRVTLASLAFGNIPAGSSSAAQTVTIKNGGTIPLQVLAIELPRAFTLAPSGTCVPAPFTLQPATLCTLAIVFAPVAQGSGDGVAHVRSGGAAPQSLLLTGSGSAGGILAGSITSLRADGAVAYAGTPVTLTATVAGSLLNPPTGNITYVDGSTPVATVPLVNGSVSLTSSAMETGKHALQAIYSGDAVYGTSTSSSVSVTVVPAPDFTLTGGAQSYSGKAAGNIVIPMTLLPINGSLNHVVQLAASGVPKGATVVFSPATLTLGGDAVTFTMTVQLPAATALKERWTATLASFACILILTVPLCRRRTYGSFAAVMMCIAAFSAMSGCGSGFKAGVNEATLNGLGTQTYIATITATTTGVLGTPLVHSSSITLVVSR